MWSRETGMTSMHVSPDGLRSQPIYLIHDEPLAPQAIAPPTRNGPVTLSQAILLLKASQ